MAPTHKRDASNSINFSINGKAYTVNPDTDNVSPQDRLVDFIRQGAGLRGTKYMCREGGCGVCVVTVKTTNSSTSDVTVKSVNSCLIPVLSCDGWDITTVEHLGNAKEGYHEIQKKLVGFNGTQCGFCSSGMVMNMYSLMESKPKGVKVKQVEGNFDGNICRCTGYRPILDAFKSLATDAPEELRSKCVDIEDSCVTCPLKTAGPGGQCAGASSCNKHKSLEMPTGERWVKATSLTEAFVALEDFQQSGLATRIVAGNTGTGVYKRDFVKNQAFLDIGGIAGLSKIETGTGNLVLGGGVTLSKAIKALKKASSIAGFEYAELLAKHIQRVANVPVRNVATLAGNLMLKNGHREFPSDLFTIFETVGAQLSIASSSTQLDLFTLTEFLSMKMDGKIIVSIHFKPYTKQHIFRSFKITRRYQNSHAYVNAGFLMKIDSGNGFKVLEKPRIVFGGISNTFTHATETEAYLNGKSLKDSSVLKEATNILKREVLPDVRHEDGSVEYRKLLTQTLLYKFILGVVGDKVKSELLSGGKNIQRNVMYGKQTYETDKSTWPINKPISKLEALPQVSGTAEYINDIHPQHGELFGAFVLSTVAKAEIRNIDSSDAYKMNGVVRFIQASDIPGANNYMVFFGTPDEIFAKDKVNYAGQAIGMILADSEQVAMEAAKKVKVEYANVEKGIFSIQDGIKRAQENGNYEELFGKEIISSAESNEKPAHVVKGEFALGAQYHFQMETHIAISVPKEDGIDVFSATQWIDLTQAAIASALKIPNNEINIQVRRLGGAFGSKISRCTQIACASAVGAHVTNRPVRVALDLQTNMEMVGKRPPYLMKYEMGVDSKGTILSLKGTVFCDTGISKNEETAEAGLGFFQSMYKALGWRLTPANIVSNTAPNTWCRAPGSTPGVALVENLMEHIAFQLKLDPVAVRLANMLKEGDQILPSEELKMTGDNFIPRMIEEIKSSGEIEARKKYIKSFNKENRWRKRGMALVPMRYALDYFGEMKYPVFVAIYKNDGTVVVSHGGIECGQGINTKVAQAVAFEFEIPLDKVRVKPTNNLITANASVTGGSITSELCVFAALQCCKELKQRMAETKEKLKPKTWEELIQLSNKNHVHLTASYMPSPNDKLNNYNIWVVNLTEVELDCLTGEYKIVRVDLVEDAGNSLNPAVDIGQIEGALVMGIGHWTTEKIMYDKDNGQLLTNGTWSYKPPLPRDIPEDIRITLLKNAPNPIGILRSKATGEPPLCSAVAVYFALKNAIYEARKDAGHDEWFKLDAPITVEDALKNCLTSPDQFSI